MFTQVRQFAFRKRTSQVELAARASKALHSAAACADNKFNPTDPYHYASGRWLNNDKLHREARRVNFDFAALCAKAVNVCPGATKVVQYEKREGGFNRAFLMTMDNGARVVAKVPYRIVGPPRLTTNSEVATMSHIQSSTKIPVPKVLDWSDDETSIGTEFIITEQAPGIQLVKVWDQMNPHQHMLCVKNVTFMISDMAKLQFPQYGSLYFADAPIDPDSKFDFLEGYCIGPHCGPKYWDCNAGETRFYHERPPNRGPWSDVASYCAGLIDAGFSRIPKSDEHQEELPYRGTIPEHHRLMNINSKVIQELARSSAIQHVAEPTLLHPDIHARNIYVSEEDPSRVTALIDWQSTSIEPIFHYAIDTPDFVEDPDVEEKILDDIKASVGAQPQETPTVDTTEEAAAKKRRDKDVLTCRKTFEVILLGKVRKLHDARAMDQTLLRPIRYCDGSWKHSAAALRQELIDLSQRWVALGLPGRCPYEPTPEELAEHAQQYEDFESVLQLKLFLKRELEAEADG